MKDRHLFIIKSVHSSLSTFLNPCKNRKSITVSI